MESASGGRVVWKLSSSSLAIVPKCPAAGQAVTADSESVQKSEISAGGLVTLTPPKSSQSDVESDSEASEVESLPSVASLPSSVSSYKSRFSENVELRQYYYGETHANDGVRRRGTRKHPKRTRSYKPKAQNEMDVHVKCTACPRIFKKNSEIIGHIFEHIDMDQRGSYVIREKRKPLRHSHLRCRICLKKTSMSTLTNHTKNTHEMKHHDFPCRICEKYFETKDYLVSHMHHTHPCLDMPYACEICGYRTSFRTQIFDHFDESHMQNCVICNFCLLVMPVESLDDMKQLESHLMQHVIGPNKHCAHCKLKFVNLEALEEHMENSHYRHSSDTSLQDIQIYKLAKQESPILMFAPLNKNPRCDEPSTNGPCSPSSTVDLESEDEAETRKDLQGPHKDLIHGAGETRKRKRNDKAGEQQLIERLHLSFTEARCAGRPAVTLDPKTDLAFFESLGLRASKLP